MDIRVLRYFLAAAEQQSISGAAQKLHVTQPTLSRQFVELEEELGHTLFVRTNRKLHLTEKDLEDIANTDAVVAYFDLISKALPDFADDVKAMSKEELLSGLQSEVGKIKDISILKYENLEKLMKDFNMSAEDAGYMLLELTQKPGNSKYIKNLIYYSQLSGQKLTADQITSLAFYNKQALKALSPERLEKIACVAKKLDISLDPYMFDRINDVEKITPDFVQKLKKEYDTIRQNGLDPKLGSRDFTADYEAMKKINEAYSKYDVSLSDIESTYYSQIEELVNLENFDKVAEFIKRLSPEAKASKLNPFYNILAKEKGVVKLDPDVSLAELYNAMAKFPDNYYLSNSFVDDLSKLGIRDFSGPAKLIDAFADSGRLPSPYGYSSNMAGNFIVANGDYDGAVEYIYSLSKTTEYLKNRNISNFAGKAQDQNFDFKRAAMINNTLAEKNVLQYYDDASKLDTLYQNQQLDINKWADFAKLVIEKHPNVNPIKFYTNHDLSELKFIPDIDKIKENADIFENMLTAKGEDFDDYSPSNYYKFLLNDVDKETLFNNINFIDEWFDNWTLAYTVNKKITKENFVIEGKTYEQIGDGSKWDFLNLYARKEKYPELYNDVKKSKIFNADALNITELSQALYALVKIKENYSPEIYKRVLDRDLLSMSNDTVDLYRLAKLDDEAFKIYNILRDAGFSLDDISALNTDDIFSANISKRANILEKLNNLPQDIDKEIAGKGIDINMYKTRLAESLGVARDVITPAKAKQTEFLREIVANNNPQAENVLKTLNFTQFNEGIPLKYPRAAFNQDIETLLSQVSEAEGYILRSHFKLEKGEAGFEGLPVVKELTGYEKQSLSEKGAYIADKIADRINEFTLNNEVLINDKQTKEVLDALIQGLPEFTTIVGKKQHGTHAYTVDIHTLKVLQSAMNDPMYKELSDQDKTILKIAAILHDTGKKGGVVDRGHASLSSDYTRAVLNKFQLNDAVKTRIIDIVDNHHWFEQYNTGQISAETMAANCRRPEDFKISMILAKSDLSSVNPTFHFNKTGTTNQAEFDAYMHDKVRPIEKKLEEMREKANIVFDTQFMQAAEKFPTQKVNINGEEVDLKVLNLTDEAINDLEQYGFAPGTTKDNARFTVHMTKPFEFPTVEALLANTSNKSTWSTSLISLDNNRTYTNRKYGFILDVDKPNVAQAYYSNLSTGTKKDINNFTSILFDQSGETRTFVRDGFIDAMKERGINLSLQDYAQISKYIFSKKYTTQIKNIKIGDTVYKAEDLVYAFEKSRDALFQGLTHSEIVSINPRIKGLIARVSDINDVPSEFLEFARKKNLPIVLIGFKNPE